MAVPVLLVAWVPLLLDRAPDAFAAPFLLGAALCCGGFAIVAYLPLPFCGTFRLAGYSSGRASVPWPALQRNNA